MSALIPIAQAAATPDGVPAWLWLFATGLGGFLAAQAPWVRAQLDAAFRERRASARRDLDELSRRLLAAQEQTAAAMASIAETNRATADALNIFASHRAADSLALDEIRRELRRMGGKAEDHAKIQPAAAPRRRRRQTEEQPA